MEQFGTCDNIDFTHQSHSTNTDQRNYIENQHSHENIPVLGPFNAQGNPDNRYHGSQIRNPPNQNTNIFPSDFLTEQWCQNPNTQHSQKTWGSVQPLMPPPLPPFPNLGKAVPVRPLQSFSAGLQNQQFLTDRRGTPFPTHRHPSHQPFPDGPRKRFAPPAPMTTQFSAQQQFRPFPISDCQVKSFSSLECQPNPPPSSNFSSDSAPLQNTSTCVTHREHSCRDEIPISSRGSQRILEKLSSESPDETEKFIQNWVEALKQKKETEKRKKKANQVKISCIQRKLLRYAYVTQELECSLECFALCDQSEGEEWKKLCMRAESLKCEAQQLQCYFEDEKNIQKIRDALNGRKEKRQRARKTKKKRKEAWRTLQQKWREESLNIDKRLEQLHQDEKAKVSEEKMKKEADFVLREVTTKQEETKKIRELFRVLTSLREARLKKGEMHGYVSSPQASSFFSKLKDEFERLIPSQLSLYESEEHTLKVMLEESQNLQSEEKKTNRMPNVEELKNQTYEILFGKYLAPSSLSEYQRSFTAADESVEVLVNRRTDWDQYLVPEEDPRGSSVPIGWVIPNINPSSDWKPFQVK